LALRDRDAEPTIEPMTVLVTGGTGLTGSFVVAELLRRGRAVRVLCRDPAKCPAGAEAALGDLADLDSLARATRDTSAIVHVACTLTDSAIDIAAMRALLAGWQRGPFVFISSLDVYGLASGSVTETSPVSETYNDYAFGKVVCERLLFEAAGSRDHVAVRAPYIWGPHVTAKRRLLVPRLLEHRPIVLPGTSAEEWGRYRDAWIDVRDLAAIVAACMDTPIGGPLNVLAGHYVWHDLFAELIRLTGSRSELVHRALEDITEDELAKKANYAQTWKFSTTRLSQQLGSLMRYSFAESLRDTVAA
jgi:nucleoside-diphosphate-sugar epimerase